MESLKTLDFGHELDIEKLCNLEAEERILGAVLLHGDTGVGADLGPELLQTLEAEAFVDERHRAIYRAIADCVKASRRPDMTTVAAALSDRHELQTAGGAFYVGRLANSVVSTAAFGEWLRIVSGYYTRRRLVEASYAIARAAHQTQESLENIAERSQKTLEGAFDGFTGAQLAVPAAGALDSLLATVERRMANETPILKSDLYDLDELIGGWRNPASTEGGRLVVIGARPAMGKCLGKGTKVVMYDGTLKAVEDVQVGDLLMGPDSTPRRVLSLARGREQMYWIRQNKGVDYRVNESHILSLKASGTAYGEAHGQVVNISVRDYLGRSEKYKIRHKGYKVAIDFPEQPVPIDPYLLGVWLGDGTAGKTEVHTPDPEIQDYILANADNWQLKARVVEKEGKCPRIAIAGKTTADSLRHALRDLKVFENKSIPQCYLSNSAAIRLQLLAGLLDTDGWLDQKFCSFEITQKSRELAYQIKFLADSLGFRVSITEKTAGIKSTGFVGLYYRLRIGGDLSIIPTKVKRKQSRPFNASWSWQVTGIKVEKDIVDDYYGFEIDGDRLFLLEDMTVTHNTSLALQLAVRLIARAPIGGLFFSLEMTAEELWLRLVSSATRIDSRRIHAGQLSQAELDRVKEMSDRFRQVPLSVYDRSGISLATIASECRAAQQRLIQQGRQLGIVVIDYFQLIETTGDRQQSLAAFSRGLKRLSRELGCDVILVSQLNRDCESRNNKRPMLADLRETGQLEQDANVVIALYRDEVYNPETTERGICEAIVLKNRAGAIGTAKLLYEPEFTQFKNLASSAPKVRGAA